MKDESKNALVFIVFSGQLLSCGTTFNSTTSPLDFDICKKNKWSSVQINEFTISDENYFEISHLFKNISHNLFAE